MKLLAQYPIVMCAVLGSDMPWKKRCQAEGGCKTMKNDLEDTVILGNNQKMAIKDNLTR